MSLQHNKIVNKKIKLRKKGNNIFIQLLYKFNINQISRDKILKLHIA